MRVRAETLQPGDRLHVEVYGTTRVLEVVTVSRFAAWMRVMVTDPETVNPATNYTAETYRETWELNPKPYAREYVSITARDDMPQMREAV